MGFLIQGFAAGVVIMGLAGGAIVGAAAEECSTRLGSDGRPKTVCSGDDLVPQAVTPDRQEMKQKLGDGWTQEVIGEPPPDCDPAAGTCPEGDAMIYGDGMLPDPQGE